MVATPHTDLIDDLTNPNVPKSEREWAGGGEILSLRARVAELESKVKTAYFEGYIDAQIEPTDVQQDWIESEAYNRHLSMETK